MSTRSPRRAWEQRADRPGGSRRSLGVDPAEELALVAHSKREILLRVHRHQLRREDLEECFGQATLELIAQVRRGGRFANRAHVANALEQRFVSRIRDRRRALAGRSPMQAALEQAASLLDGEGQPLDVPDARAELEALAIARQDLREVIEHASSLTSDQRLALAAQLGLLDRRELCLRHDWSAEKYRKVGQRARARLRALLDAEQPLVPGVASPS